MSCIRTGLSIGAVLAVAFGLVGCSSSSDGGGSKAPGTAPALSMAPQGIKNFRFTWSDVSGESEYLLLENPDGKSEYSQIATLEANTTSYDHAVFLPGRINAIYILRACNSGGCKDSLPVSPSDNLIPAVGYVKASNSSGLDNFGASVTLSADGNTLAVGAEGEDSAATGIDGEQGDGANESGAVYVFTLSAGVWSQQAYVKASNTGAGDNFGYSVALSADGNTLAVGADLEDSSAIGIDGDQGGGAEDSGAVFIFVRNAGSWSQQAYVKAFNTGADDWFGSSVALSADGNTLAVGAEGEDSDATGIDGSEADGLSTDSGAVYVFTRAGVDWSRQAYVKASNTGADDAFGVSVALSADGNTLAVGADLEDSSATGIGGDQGSGAADSGAAYLFTRSAGIWSQQAYVKASNTEAGDWFGSSVALSADGNTLAVGADLEENESGAAYVYTRSGDTWSHQAYVKASNAGAGDWFGTSVALSSDGNTLAVGASGESGSAKGVGGDQASDLSTSGSGAVYLYKRSGSTWSQQSYVKASNTEKSDAFGDAVALDAEGATLAVGAAVEESNAIGVGGDQADNSLTGAGAAYLY